MELAKRIKEDLNSAVVVNLPENKDVNDKKVNAPKGTKTVSMNSSGKLVYKDKSGRPIRKGNTNAPKSPSAKRGK